MLLDKVSIARKVRDLGIKFDEIFSWVSTREHCIQQLTLHRSLNLKINQFICKLLIRLHLQAVIQFHQLSLFRIRGTTRR